MLAPPIFFSTLSLFSFIDFFKWIAKAQQHLHLDKEQTNFLWSTCGAYNVYLHSDPCDSSKYPLAYDVGMRTRYENIIANLKTIVLDLFTILYEL